MYFIIIYNICVVVIYQQLTTKNKASEKKPKKKVQTGKHNFIFHFANTLLRAEKKVWQTKITISGKLKLRERGRLLFVGGPGLPNLVV